MTKILIHQQLYNLADDALEYQLLDLRSFLQFLGFTESSTIPDAKTIWLFRDRLAQAARCGPDRRRFAGAGAGPAQQARGGRHRQGRHVDAKWTKKDGKSHFGYKLHASIDRRHQLVRKVVITHAAVVDTTVFEHLLDPSNTSRDVHADRGYPNAESKATLTAAGWRVQIQRKGSATKPIPYRHTTGSRQTRLRR